ncbi:unnamed protein product [Cuscuta epithymum]|uniref:Uncharacterized protein n=1 Tax=Cuscuta epithymum TaxID=186058 RepID=A0AAV0D8U1_9ASTE|nr:unnamed protein product [Cuscuta epithymum]
MQTNRIINQLVMTSSLVSDMRTPITVSVKSLGKDCARYRLVQLSLNSGGEIKKQSCWELIPEELQVVWTSSGNWLQCGTGNGQLVSEAEAHFSSQKVSDTKGVFAKTKKNVFQIFDLKKMK